MGASGWPWRPTARNKVPVSYVGLTDAEKDLILSTLDQITAMAVPHAAKLAALMFQVETEFPDLACMLETLGINGAFAPRTPTVRPA
jgi:hypothetical protein